MTNANGIVFLGSCNIDFFVYTNRLPSPGETLHGTKFVTSYGGKGANQCIAAAKLGAPCSFIGRLGKDVWGNDYKKYLQEHNVETSNVVITENESTGIAQITVSADGENHIIIVAGANNAVSKEDVFNAKNIIENGNILVAQLEIPYHTTLEAFKIAKGIKILNAAPARQDLDEILPLCSILCVNETEASIVSGDTVNSISDAAKVIKTLLKKGCEIVIVTLGKDGVVYNDLKLKKIVHVPCETVTPVDTTGAGDAFIGALATFLCKYPEKPFHQIIGAAEQVATISVMKEGTQKSYPTNIETFKKEYNFKIIE